MSAVTLSPELRAELNGMNETIEIRDEGGRVVGRFLPEAEYRRLLYAAAQAACPFSDEELARRRQETGGTSLAEFWRGMGRAS